ncbi:Protein asteroid [Gryllus bimaculatus]|nr:Protein asteroid [Gryllus bimaculatus]
MGIRGLATFIAHNSSKYLEDHELKDCYLVIDGNSFACQLYSSSSTFNSAFGGDYNRFAASVIEFFDALKKCKVIPLVIFDGGYEIRKLKTAFSRIRQKWFVARDVTPMSSCKNSVFPCFLKEVVKDVLRELQISFAQSLFEADSEIAAIARRLKCPVLSYDSDFFVYDVLYIPFPTLYLNPCSDKSSQSTDATYYMSCSLYRVENFLKRYGGLQKEILPFLSIMLGCDYIGNRVYKYFVSKLKRKTGRVTNKRQRRIASLLEWLRNETLESAKSKVIGCLKKHKKEGLKFQIKKIISMYVQDSSELLPYLGIDVSSLDMELTDDKKHVMNIWEDQGLSDDCLRGDSDSENRDDDTCSSNDISSESDGSEFNDEYNEEQSETTGEQQEIICSWEMRKACTLPSWFHDRFRKGTLPSAFLDMAIHNIYFLPPQVEDYNYPSSHIISLKIIAVIYGLLVSCEYVKPLRCQIRKHHSPNHCIEVKPIFETLSIKFSLNELPRLSIAQRLSILLEVAGLNLIDQKRISSLPESWQLYIVALVFWATQAKEPPVNSSHINAVLLSLILLDVVSKNVICLGSTKKSRRKQKNMVKKARSGHNCNVLFTCALMMGNRTNEELSENMFSNQVVDTEFRRGNVQDICDTESICNEEVKISTNNVVEALEHVNPEECSFVKKILRPLCLVEEKLKTRPKLFCVSIVHTFAQFQSCLLHFSYLNSLLEYPLPHCISFRAFSGTFAYNMYNNLKHRTDAVEYLSHLLSTAPSVLALFKFLSQEIKCLIPNVQSAEHIKKKTRKKKLPRRIEKNTNASSEHEENFIDAENPVDTDFEDPCNRFAVLTMRQ